MASHLTVGVPSGTTTVQGSEHSAEAQATACAIVIVIVIAIVIVSLCHCHCVIVFIITLIIPIIVVRFPTVLDTTRVEVGHHDNDHEHLSMVSTAVRHHPRNQ